MTVIEKLLKEMDAESKTTRKMLSRIPNDKYSWKPHEKSMTIEQLSTHIAELPTWVSMAVTTDELDFATAPYEPKKVSDTDDLLMLFEVSLADGKKHLENTSEEILDQNWTLRNGDQIYSTSTKEEVIRMTYCQIVHHRAQLGVYLRLLDIPIPGSYGPSADDQGF
ncbi:damage-inducible protein DinB [Solitalea longa]|uniref:Damage-inducible protein DinB n=1 Tax=Solitalea longa TaxID=2079460 RepID=A0A2S5A878_9SPHI|nr:DinB family protein [Solitalea longa]POY38303.1 damage-inducible protein DinB [Solitalea longa]